MDIEVTRQQDLLKDIKIVVVIQEYLQIVFKHDLSELEAANFVDSC